MILASAFLLRREHWLVPDRGAGYALGIAGLGAMTALLGYSVRKRLRAARRWGPVPAWFRVHMFLGIAGPTAILLHCNFALGSTNANVALASALAVSASGVVGRLLYGRIHAGLFGRRLTLLELRDAIGERRAGLEGASTLSMEPLERFESGVVGTRGLLRSAAALPLLSYRRRRALKEAFAGNDCREEDDVRRDVEIYLQAVQRAGVFRACERLFALWHVVHLPLCVVLFAAAAVHVVVVHVY